MANAHTLVHNALIVCAHLHQRQVLVQSLIGHDTETKQSTDLKLLLLHAGLLGAAG